MKKTSLHKSGLNSRFDAHHLGFHAYVSKMRHIIEKTRPDLTEENAEKIIDANSPYEWLPSASNALNPKTGKIKNGVLLVHGLFDSPTMMLSSAQYFQNRNFLVRTILLPGHGTVPGDMLDVSYIEWIKATQFGIESFAQQVDHLYLCGFSTGAALIIHQVLTEIIPNLAGLFLFAPALKLLTPIAILSNLNNLIYQTIGGIQWVTRSASPDYAKYTSFTLNSARQVQLLMHDIHQLLKTNTIDVPIFAIGTQDDEVLSVRTMLAFFNAFQHKNSRFILYGNESMTFGDKRIELVGSAFPDKNIINFSHMSLPISPEHPHYGEHGDYHDYLMHEETPHQTTKIITGEFQLGAVTHTNVRQHLIRRLTYNPDFANLLEKIESFMTSLDPDPASAA